MILVELTSFSFSSIELRNPFCTLCKKASWTGYLMLWCLTVVSSLDSCLIARNLLSGLKTCLEVYHYLNFIENKAMYCAADGSHSLVDGHAKVDFNNVEKIFFCCRVHPCIQSFLKNFTFFTYAFRALMYEQGQGSLGDEAEYVA